MIAACAVCDLNVSVNSLLMPDPRTMLERSPIRTCSCPVRALGESWMPQAESGM